MIRYRTEVFSGTGIRNALSVMVFETCELWNTDIPETLAHGVLADNPISVELLDLAIRINSQNEVSINEVKKIFERALDAINSVTGEKIRYALWLADAQQVKEKYWRFGNGVYNSEKECPEPTEGDIVPYETGPIILSDLGVDGTLYGYEDFPIPFKTTH